MKLMMGQTAPKGMKLNIRPKFLLTGAAYMNTALLFAQSINFPVATYNGNTANPYSILTAIADANISANHWYLVADPALAETVEVAFLDGKETPTVIETENPNGILGRTYSCYLDAGAKVLDFRGLFANL
jgi:hypothetical protein